VAELNDVLGAILRDVAQARVTSDLFSRSVSLDYREDEILSGFPVPRVEVMQATIDLKFAVNDVERREVDPRAIMRARLGTFAADLARQVYSDLIATNPRGEELEDVIRTKGLTIEARLPVAIERTVVANLGDLEAAIDLKPEALARKLQGEVAELILKDDDLKEVLTRGTRVADIRERTSVAAATSIDALRREAARLRTAEGEIDLDRVPVTEYAARLGDRLYAEFVLANPRRVELLKVAAEQGVRLEQELPQMAENVLREDREALRTALEAEPDALVERLESELFRTVLRADPIKAVLTRRTRITDIRTRIATLVSTAIASFAKEVAAAIEAAQRGAVGVDVAVTTDELSDVHETAVSTLTVVSEVRNYEWVDVGGEGPAARRLQAQ